MLQSNRTLSILWRQLRNSRSCYYIGICSTSIVCLMLLLLPIHRFTPNTNNTAVAMNDILTLQRQRIAEEMKSFDYDDPSARLNSLTPETGGKPFRSVIVTTWRSGSTFLGDIINAMPANLYRYEPLLNYEITQIREGSPQAAIAQRNIHQLLTCNYTNMDEYLEYGKAVNYHFTHNHRLWQYCQLYPQLCWNGPFLSDFCKMFPLQSMKIVRLRLSLTESLLNDPELDNVRIVLLVRDPRGTMQSRKHRDWCPGHPDCDDPAQLCGDLEADFWAAQSLLEKFPHRLKVIRYEDLSQKPYAMTQSILHFYGLPFAAPVKEFLDSHTRVDVGDGYSTFRESRLTPYHWINELSFGEIEHIQSSCVRAMELWGYRLAERTTFRRRTFNSLRNYTMAAST